MILIQIGPAHPTNDHSALSCLWPQNGFFNKHALLFLFGKHSHKSSLACTPCCRIKSKQINLHTFDAGADVVQAQLPMTRTDDTVASQLVLISGTQSDPSKVWFALHDMWSTAKMARAGRQNMG